MAFGSKRERFYQFGLDGTRFGAIPHSAFAPVPNAEFTATAHAARHELRAGRGEDVCNQQSCSGDRAATGSSSAHYRCGLALLSFACTAGGSSVAWFDRLSEGRS